MSVIAIIIALGIEQWQPFIGRRAYASFLSRWVIWVERSFNAGEVRQGVVAWCAAVLPIVVAAVAIRWALAHLNPLLAWFFDIVVLYLTLGFRQSGHYFTGIQAALQAGDLERARELLAAWRGEPILAREREEVIRLAVEDALVTSHRHVYGVLLWYVLLPGPSGAILYRLVQVLRDRWHSLGEFGKFAGRVNFALDWPAVRLTALAFALVGDFEDAVACWRDQARLWPQGNEGIVIAAGAGAMGVMLGNSRQEAGGEVARPELGVGIRADEAALHSTVGLLWRALIFWLFLLALIVVAGAVI